MYHNQGEPKRRVVQHHHTKLSYSPKMARAGKDIGKPGKTFARIEAVGNKRYGAGHGAKIAGAVLAKLRKKY